jgi:hypothetical protein
MDGNLATVRKVNSQVTQVITITPSGELQGLDHKRKGLDLRAFGKAKTRRATLIEWEDALQMWFITWATDKEMPSKVWDSALFMSCGVRWGDYHGVSMLDPHDVIFFDDYEDAVDAEVAVIQAMQLAGRTDCLYS